MRKDYYKGIKKENLTYNRDYPKLRCWLSQISYNKRLGFFQLCHLNGKLFLLIVLPFYRLFLTQQPKENLRIPLSNKTYLINRNSVNFNHIVDSVCNFKDCLNC